MYSSVFVTFKSARFRETNADDLTAGSVPCVLDSGYIDEKDPGWRSK